MVAETDIQLVEQIRRGDSAGLDALHDKYADEIWRFTLMRVKDPDVAWDIVQETFARAAKHLRDFEGGELAAHWLHRVAKNLSTDHHRRQRRIANEPVDDDAEDVAEVGPEAMLMRGFEHHLVRQAFARLSTEDQAILWGREVEGRSVGDLAVEYGMTNGAMRVKLNRARVRLRLHAAAVGLGALIPVRLTWPLAGGELAAGGVAPLGGPEASPWTQRHPARGRDGWTANARANARCSPRIGHIPRPIG